MRRSSNVRLFFFFFFNSAARLLLFSSCGVSAVTHQLRQESSTSITELLISSYVLAIFPKKKIYVQRKRKPNVFVSRTGGGGKGIVDNLSSKKVRSRVLPVFNCTRGRRFWRSYRFVEKSTEQQPTRECLRAFVKKRRMNDV